ncbi:MAG TPA: SpoIID/LytB domain-containing protein [Thermoleophilia bacterium]|nr:SpoIID/LytB domain-containing protein [Thermoleophilia bacterium]
MPHEPMHTPHPTSPARPATCASPRRGGRRGKLALAGAFVLLILLAVAGPAAAFTSQYAFTISGHGWGHGIGMSQWGAYGYAKHGWTYKAILKHYYTGISFASVEDSIVRVNLRSGLGAVKLTCPSEYTVQGTGAAWTIPAGTTATTTWTSTGYKVVAGAFNRVFTGDPTFTPSKGALRLITKTDLGDDGAYRGTIRVTHTSGGLMMLNRVRLESYLRGVVPHEVSWTWPREALRAQACAARAYALGSLQPGKSWDVYCDVRDQAYAGAGIEQASTNAAVRDTTGVCPSYGGKPILATYFSSSGGRTENIELAWPGASTIPYLKGVPDPYDTYATLHDWGPLRRTPSQIGRPLGAAGSVRAVYTVKRGTSPRIVKAAVIGSGGTKYVDGSSLRMKLGLNSTWAVFTSMGISPAARDGAAVGAGGSITLKGRLYPAIADGAKVSLRAYYGGAWHSKGVVTKRVSESLPGGYAARYSAYSVRVAPAATTKYYFSSGKAKSPVTTIKVD